MILMEAFLLGVSGTIVGLIIGYLCYLPLAESGLDLRSFSEGLNGMGIGAIIYPNLTQEDLITSVFIVPIVSVLGAIYPAIKAVRLEPISAIRHV